MVIYISRKKNEPLYIYGIDTLFIANIKKGDIVIIDCEEDVTYTVDSVISDTKSSYHLRTAEIFT